MIRPAQIALPGQVWDFGGAKMLVLSVGTSPSDVIVTDVLRFKLNADGTRDLRCVDWSLSVMSLVCAGEGRGC